MSYIRRAERNRADRELTLLTKSHPHIKACREEGKLTLQLPSSPQSNFKAEVEARRRMVEVSYVVRSDELP